MTVTYAPSDVEGPVIFITSPTEGHVYKNINIWVGTSGFATPRNIKEALIKFRVDNNWMSANSVTSSDIILKKWNGNSWIELETRVLSKDDTNTFFEGKTNAFSPFAITVKTDGVKSSATSLDPEAVHDKTSQQPAQTPIITRIASSGISNWFIILIILIINIIIVAMYFLWVNK